MNEESLNINDGNKEPTFIGGIIKKMITGDNTESSNSISLNPSYSERKNVDLVVRKPETPENEVPNKIGEIVKTALGNLSGVTGIGYTPKEIIKRSSSKLASRVFKRNKKDSTRTETNLERLFRILTKIDKSLEKGLILDTKSFKIFEGIYKNTSDIKQLLSRDRFAELESLREKNKNTSKEGGIATKIEKKEDEKGFISKLIDGILPFFTANIIGKLLKGIPGASAVVGLVKKIPGLLKNVKGIFKSIPKLLSGVVGIFKKIPNILKSLGSIIGKLPAVLTKFGIMLRNIPSIAAKLFNQVKTAAIGSSAGRMISSGLSKAKNVGSSILEQGKSWGGAALDFGKKGFSKIGSGLLSFGERAGGYIGSGLTKIGTASKALMRSKLVAGVKKALPRIGKNVGKFFGPVLTAILSAVDLYSTVKDAKSTAMENLLTNPSGAKQAIDAGKEKIGVSVSRGLGSVGGSILGGVLGSFIPVPGLGTIIGALGGGYVGDLVGGLIGDAIGGRSIYDSLAPLLEPLGLGLDDLEAPPQSGEFPTPQSEDKPSSGSSLTKQMQMLDVRTPTRNPDLEFFPSSDSLESSAIQSIDMNQASKIAVQYQQPQKPVSIEPNVTQYNVNNSQSYYVGKQYVRNPELETIKRYN
jgi:hypothetical protein